VGALEGDEDGAGKARAEKCGATAAPLERGESGVRSRTNFSGNPRGRLTGHTLNRIELHSLGATQGRRPTGDRVRKNAHDPVHAEASRRCARRGVLTVLRKK
jgi:hypothetical protein